MATDSKQMEYRCHLIYIPLTWEVGDCCWCREGVVSTLCLLVAEDGQQPSTQLLAATHGCAGSAADVRAPAQCRHARAACKAGGVKCRFCSEAGALKNRCTNTGQRARAGYHLRSKPRKPAVWPQRCVSGAYERRDYSPHQHSISHPGSRHSGNPGSHNCAGSRDTGRCAPTGSRGPTGAAGRSQPACRRNTHRLCTRAAALSSTDCACACNSDGKPNCGCTCTCTGTLHGPCTRRMLR